MKRPDLSHDRYSTAFAPAYEPAHSGPELATCVPYPSIAQELARELLTEQFELTRTNVHAHSTYAGFADGMTIGLARR